METPEDIASSMLSYPFAECGRDARGIDCVGIVLEFHRRRGLHLPDPASWNTKEVLAHRFAEYFEPVLILKSGDVIRMGERHLGVLVGKNVLHCNERQVIMTPLSRLRGIVRGWYRYKGGPR